MKFLKNTTFFIFFIFKMHFFLEYDNTNITCSFTSLNILFNINQLYLLLLLKMPKKTKLSC
ncbi:hypothetical protein B0A58_02930 [Flavobacterium branchiophilum NBRC 15030 = ATCC 35035]|uniref:Uncharacterized protein n=1 Tax=Flavobacterium branchiophilum TaxID=55197 RepID=A0A2H3KT85_9FLAO|nr:hypothetical protein B0A58_02930 [Flavobacterium branchiophilum NBRC 15030 = ATCC 35035]PDS22967.1 hypothetical protein B0A77_12020 [Flavobacterium branchiophilum]TQM40132.1 hypothetical protein BC670_1001 [Flavobacterium branchiophilum]